MKKICSIAFLTCSLLFIGNKMLAQCPAVPTDTCFTSQQIAGNSNPFEACLIQDLCLLDGHEGTINDAGIIVFQPPIWCTTVENNLYYAFAAPASQNVTFYITAINCVGGNLGIQAAILDCNFNLAGPCLNIDDGNTDMVANSNPMTPGDLYYLMLDGNAGSVCDYIINVEGQVVADAGPDGIIDCSGAPYTLDGTGSSTGPGISYEWTAQNCCILSGANTLTPIVNTQGWYYLTVTDNASSCSATDSVYVHGLVVDIDPALISCDLTAITLHAEVTGSSVGEFGFWSTLDGNIVSGVNTTDPVINAPGTYCYQTISLGQFCMVEECIDVGLDQSTCAKVEGYVLVDENSNCQTDAGEMPLSGWLVTATGSNGTFYGTTDNNGFYSIPVESGDYTVTLTVANSTYVVCDNDIDVSLPFNTSIFLLDFSVPESLPCPVLTVDISNFILRRCNGGNFFHVNYCNEGTETAIDAYVEVTLDPDLTFVYSSIGSMTTHVGGQVYSFAVGDLAPDECGQFWFQAFLDCDVEIGETHCTEAHIFPDTPCFPSNPLWSGASLEVQASCTDSTRFTITNVGSANVTIPAGYLVIEDAVMYRAGQVGLLSPGDSMVVTLPANGSTWRLELEQEPFHPTPNVPVAWIEGCGENVAGSFSTGYVNQLFLGDPELHTDIDCTVNQAAFDPNDKQGFPLGHSAEHFIQKENQIEYLIRFQNTGNDTAFQVVIQDTLDAKLDLSTLRPGASSHLYEYEIYGTGILKFSFPNILLPDSTTDFAGSQGFVQFIVSPKLTVEPGDVIENEAAIYFDNNAPIITNTTFHTIEKPKVYEMEMVQICFGETFNGLEITEDTMLTEVFPFADYDSISFTNLQVLPIFDAAVSATICEGESYFFANENLTQTGTYTAVFTALNGCDSTVVLTLDILNNVETELTEEICAGSIYPFNGQLLTSTGIYEETLQSTNGCDSLVRLDLQVLEVFETTMSVEICDGSSFEFNGENLTGSGVYEAMLMANNGCDSLVVLNLEVSNNLEENITVNICAGESYEFGGEVLTGSGFYEMTVPASGGCDSTTVLSLMVWDQYEMARKATICHGDSAEFNGAFFYDSGYYTAELTTINGCDSILILDLTVLDSIGSSFSHTICENEPFIFNGEMLSETGEYEAVFPSSEGCDSTVVLSLNVEPSHVDSNDLNLVSGELFNGQPIFNDTTITENLVAQNGCDSIIVTNITVEVNSVRENFADEIGLSIFPNPTDENFFVKFNLHERQNVQLEILDIIGQNVVFASQKSTFSVGEHFVEINANSWPSGVYLVHFKMDSGVATGRVVVE